MIEKEYLLLLKIKDEELYNRILKIFNFFNAAINSESIESYHDLINDCMNNDVSIIDFIDEMLADGPTGVACFQEIYQRMRPMLELKEISNEDIGKHEQASFVVNAYLMFGAYHYLRDEILKSEELEKYSMFLETLEIASNKLYCHDALGYDPKAVIYSICSIKDYLSIPILKECLKGVLEKKNYSGSVAVRRTESIIDCVLRLEKVLNYLQNNGVNYNSIDIREIEIDSMDSDDAVSYLRDLTKILLVNGHLKYIDKKIKNCHGGRLDSAFDLSVFDCIKDMNFTFFETIDKVEQKDSFIELMDYVFDSDSFYELFEKLDTLFNVTDDYGDKDYATIKQEINNFLNSNHKKVLKNGVVMSLDSGNSEVNKPADIFERMPLFIGEYIDDIPGIIFHYYFKTDSESITIYNIDEIIDSELDKRMNVKSDGDSLSDEDDCEQSSLLEEDDTSNDKKNNLTVDAHYNADNRYTNHGRLAYRIADNGEIVVVDVDEEERQFEKTKMNKITKKVKKIFGGKHEE